MLDHRTTVLDHRDATRPRNLCRAVVHHAQLHPNDIQTLTGRQCLVHNTGNGIAAAKYINHINRNRDFTKAGIDLGAMPDFARMAGVHGINLVSLPRQKRRDIIAGPRLVWRHADHCDTAHSLQHIAQKVIRVFVRQNKRTPEASPGRQCRNEGQ